MVPFLHSCTETCMKNVNRWLRLLFLGPDDAVTLLDGGAFPHLMNYRFALTEGYEFVLGLIDWLIELLIRTTFSVILATATSAT